MEAAGSRRDVLRAGAAALGLGIVGCRAQSARDEVVAPAEPHDDGERDDVLAQLLAEMRCIDPESGGGAFHLPMGLCALRAIGADDARLREVGCAGLRGQAPFPADPCTPLPERWQDELGSRAALGRLRRRFDLELERAPREQVLQRVLPELVPTLSCFGYHGAIRVAYAIRFGGNDELAYALAFWASRADALGALPAPLEHTEDPGDVSERLRTDLGGPAQPMNAGSVVRDLRRAAATPGFESVTRSLRIDDGTHARISELATRTYLSVPNLTTLHGITGTHACRVLAPYVADRERLVRFELQAVAAVFIAAGMPTLGREPDVTPPEWSVLRERAIASADDHDVKLCDSALEEARVRNDAMYRRAVAVRLRVLA
jgi:hypothetical protein